MQDMWIPGPGLARNRLAARSDSSLDRSALSASTSCMRFRRRSSARRLRTQALFNTLLIMPESPCWHRTSLQAQVLQQPTCMDRLKGIKTLQADR